jgi:hypothetical protein
VSRRSGNFSSDNPVLRCTARNDGHDRCDDGAPGVAAPEQPSRRGVDRGGRPSGGGGFVFRIAFCETAVACAPRVSGGHEADLKLG